MHYSLTYCTPLAITGAYGFFPSSRVALDVSWQNYTQNIDTLETLAGVKHVLQCHGSFATASCLNCKVRVQGKEIEKDILNQEVPLCKLCNSASQSSVPIKRKGRKKRKSNGWNSDESDESDKSEFPPGIMKVNVSVIPGA